MTPQQLADFIAEQERKQRAYEAKRRAWVEENGIKSGGGRGK